MALQVWLPLNGNLNNQGLNCDATIECSSESYATNGKIGKCFNNASNIDINIPSLNGSKIWSVCFWGYVNSSLVTSNWTGILVMHDNSDSLRIETCPKTYSDGKYCYSVHNNSHCMIMTNTFSNKSGDNYYDKWVHCCLTSDGKTISRYINGVLKNKATYNGSGAINGIFTLRNNHVIMKNDFRVYDHCLSVKEIKEISKGLILHYKLDNNGFGENIIKNSLINESSYSYGFATREAALTPGKVYTLSFNGRISEEAKADGTVLSVFIYTPNWSWEKHISINSTTDITQSRTFTYPSSATETNIKIAAYSYKDYKVSGNKVTLNWYKLEEGKIATPWCPNSSDDLYTNLGLDDTTVYDSSGYNNNGIKNGLFNIDSNSSKYNINTIFNDKSFISTKLNISSISEFTLSFWLNGKNGEYAYKTLFSNNIDLGSHGLWIAYNIEGAALWFYNGKYACSNISYLEYDKWYHIVFKYYNGIVTWYLNGKKLTETDVITSKGIYINLNNFYIGNPYTGLTWNTNFAGSLSDIRLYATVLSDEDIKKLYNVQTSVDNEGNVYSYEFNDSASNMKISKKGIFNHGDFYESADYMDMETLTLDTGEVFVRILHHNSQNGTLYFTKENALDIQTEHLYSRLGLMENYRMPDGKFEFLATQSNDSNLYRWKQSSNPVISETLEGFESITGNNNGLCKNPYSAACAISNKSNNWWCAIGSWSNYNNAIPGFSNKEVNEINLYVRVCPERFRSFSNYLTCNTINEI